MEEEKCMKLNNVVKKTLAGVMVAAMIVTPIPEVGNVKEVYAAESNEDYFEYDVENNLVTIAGYVGEDTQVKIPSEIEGKKVVCIGGLSSKLCKLFLSHVFSEFCSVNCTNRYSSHF